MDVIVWAISGKIEGETELSDPMLVGSIIDRETNKEIERIDDEDVDTFLSKLKPHLENYIDLFRKPSLELE